MTIVECNKNFSVGIGTGSKPSITITLEPSDSKEDALGIALIRLDAKSARRLAHLLYLMAEHVEPMKKEAT